VGEDDLRWGRRELVEVDGVRVHVESAGRGRPGRPSLACLHGFASGTFTWAGTAPPLADDHRVVAWDRPPRAAPGRGRCGDPGVRGRSRRPV